LGDCGKVLQRAGLGVEIFIIHVISLISHTFPIHTMPLIPLSLGLTKRRRKTFKTDLQKPFDSCVGLFFL